MNKELPTKVRDHIQDVWGQTGEEAANFLWNEIIGRGEPLAKSSIELLAIARADMENYADMGHFARPDVATPYLIDGFQFGWRKAFKTFQGYWASLLIACENTERIGTMDRVAWANEKQRADGFNIKIAKAQEILVRMRSASECDFSEMPYWSDQVIKTLNGEKTE